MDRSIFIVGTEFDEQTIIDKKVDIVFSNPPYSHYSQWAEKIITEAHARVIYLVIPQRWHNNDTIEHAITAREGKSTVLGSFNFLNAERAARAQVDLVKIRLCGRYYYQHSVPRVDPFALWFEQNFHIDVPESERSQHTVFSDSRERLTASLSQALVEGGSLIEILDRLYRRDLTTLVETYQKLSTIDAGLLKEMNIDLASVRGALEMKISGLKDLYWHELFNNLDKVTIRLTAASRQQLLATLTKHTHVDFTVSNAYAVVIWVIKNSNVYFDEQLISTVERMVAKANIKLYQSNERTFGDELWHYCRAPAGLDRYKLDYRIVLDRIGGLSVSEWHCERTDNGLSRTAGEFLDDLRTIASNLGFDTLPDTSAKMHWDTHVKNEFRFRTRKDGQVLVLFEAKAYKNGNLHIKFNQGFICRLNIEFGRLKGWIKSPKEAAEELDISLEQASKGFDSNLKLADASILKLGFQVAA